MDPSLAWAMKALEQFKDPDFEVEVPGDGILMEDIDGIDPNSDSVIAAQ